jgi:serine protease
MKITRIATFLVLVCLAGCSKQTTETALKPMSGTDINQKIHLVIEKTGRFTWADADEFMLWSAVMHGDSILTIGYGDAPFSELKSAKLQNQKEQIISLVKSNEDQTMKLKSDKDVTIYDNPILNYIDVKVSNIETIKQLRTMNNIRYMEPSGYSFFAYEQKLKSSSGCNNSAETINAADYSIITPNCMVSWTYYKHNITQAWNYSTGQGITVGLIDTGISDAQNLLGSNFNDGYSSGRTISKYGTYVDSFWPWVSSPTDGTNDKCGHGTCMGATIASPRNDDGQPVGVAYNCNLIAYRGTSDVVLDDYHEQKGVANALTGLANLSEVKVISMSIGHIISIGVIEDAIKYAYSKDKLIIAAGGTSTTFTNWVGVIFPAWMPECVAVTGITDASGYNACSVCHKGSKIDFAVIMERSGTSRNSVCLGYTTNTQKYVGGSSVATSTTAGIAALVWGVHPSWSRSQVLQKMKESASLYPNRDANFGYGYIDALKAVQ